MPSRKIGRYFYANFMPLSVLLYVGEGKRKALGSLCQICAGMKENCQ